MPYHDTIRYELVVSENMEEHMGYECRIGDHYFTQTANPGVSYRCFTESPFYNHNIYFKRISQKYPEEVFMLKGDGRDRGDFWCKYYKNGRVQEEKGRIVFPDFDSSKLKKIE
jgi:hypothetical protein